MRNENDTILDWDTLFKLIKAIYENISDEEKERIRIEFKKDFKEWITQKNLD